MFGFEVFKHAWKLLDINFGLEWHRLEVDSGLLNSWKTDGGKVTLVGMRSVLGNGDHAVDLSLKLGCVRLKVIFRVVNEMLLCNHESILFCGDLPVRFVISFNDYVDIIVH